MKIKPRTYYKQYFNNTVMYKNCYNILYTGTKYVYELAYTDEAGNIFRVTDDNKYLETIIDWQERIDNYNPIIEEISEADVFLELL